MRLIGSFETEKEAYAFYSFLLKEGIQNIYEAFTEEKTGHKQYRIWIYDEDQFEDAAAKLAEFKSNPSDPKFLNAELPLVATPPPPNYAEISQKENLKWQTVPSIPKRRRFAVTLTHLIIAICALLFIWNDFELRQIAPDENSLAAKIAWTPLMKTLFFDYPTSFQYFQELLDNFPLNSYKEEKELPPAAQDLLKQALSTPSWNGLYAYFVQLKQGSKKQVVMFEKIRQGEVWRFFTPCMLHLNFLHLLFNMILAWMLLKQIEERVNKWKICLLILLIGVISNTAQYLMSGPFFLGFSGVIVGLAGFIWMRQKVAPWEGYPLQKSTLLFLLFFVIAMFALELFSFSLQMFSGFQLSPNIANTAHIVGGLSGILLARTPFFNRRFSS